MNKVLVALSLLLTSALCGKQNTDTDGGLCRIRVREHYLTLEPSSEKVKVINENCVTIIEQQTYLQCSHELSGNYTWYQENPGTNYVLFEFSQREFVSEIDVTYEVKSKSERPKVTFCPLPDNFDITKNFRGLECEEVSIKANTAETVSLASPFVNETRKVAMEVITQGIKTDFKTTAVQFYTHSCTTMKEHIPSATTLSKVTTEIAKPNNSAVVDEAVNSGAMPRITIQAIAMTLLMTTALVYM